MPRAFPEDRTMALDSSLRLSRPDDFYQALIDLHAGLTEAQSAAVNARLVLLLANQVGDLQTLNEAMAAARKGIESQASPGESP